jgi:hypothetical protein
MHEEPRAEHRWLEKLVGEWTYEGECIMGPDQPTMTTTGVETVRSLGGLWTIGEGENAMPDGRVGKSVMTLGFDARSGRYVGTFIVSIMTHLWTYDGAIEGDALVLDAEGPSFNGEGAGKYRDTIEFTDDDHRTLKSHALRPDGQWQLFMTARYTRKT